MSKFVNDVKDGFILADNAKKAYIAGAWAAVGAVAALLIFRN